MKSSLEALLSRSIRSFALSLSSEKIMQTNSSGIIGNTPSNDALCS